MQGGDGQDVGDVVEVQHITGQGCGDAWSMRGVTKHGSSRFGDCADPAVGYKLEVAGTTGRDKAGRTACSDGEGGEGARHHRRYT
jgi:hypothetical protein